MSECVKVIDLFAGPGGLGEGFSSLQPEADIRPFKIALSIEKDKYAHQTLLLRSFLRQFEPAQAPDDYYTMLRQTDVPFIERRKLLFETYPYQAWKACGEAWHVELGKQDHASVHNRITDSLCGADIWVLLGGPPCQAFSVAGRSRNKGNPEYRLETDARQYLYVEYLHVIAEHGPAVFVMENVKGLLSATDREQRIFNRMVEDLHDPARALSREGRSVRAPRRAHGNGQYGIFSLVKRGLFDGGDVRDFIVHMDRYGIPQARHRMILLGVRHDLLQTAAPGVLRPRDEVPAQCVLDGLPCLRAGLSRQADSPEAWRECLLSARHRRWFAAALRKGGEGTYRQLVATLDHLACPRHDRGGEFMTGNPTVRHQADWYLDQRLNGVCNHSTRAHIVKDLQRYLYAACYGKAQNRSPLLRDFPADLLPKHGNVGVSLAHGNFADRFRVQIATRPATTITSHISKDGHYYVHYDPSQCRSFTVREAARLQTFPDNYFFCGPRTAQYTQVGNAVPPLLAKDIAQVVWDMFIEGGAVNIG